VVEVITVFGTAFGGGGPHPARPIDAVALVLLVVAAGAVAFAQPWPVPSLSVSLLCTVGYYALGYHTDSAFFVGLLVTGYRAGTAGARVRAAGFVVVTVALFAVVAAVGHPADPNAGLWVSVIVVGGQLTGQAAAEWQARVNRQAEHAHEEESLRRIAEERLRIARELHDVVSHSIAMINVQAGVAVHVMDERPEEARAALVAIKTASRDALRDLRGILGLLRQTDEPESRLPAAGLGEVPALVENVQRGARVAVTLDLDTGESPLPTSVDLAAYRVIQEALTNVVRHAPGSSATVAVRRRPDALIIEVENDGQTAVVAGSDGRQGAGHGLAGMRERVRAAGGSVDAGRRPEGGFAVHATLPLESE
jgi:signal transduction histidine kinase